MLSPTSDATTVKLGDHVVVEFERTLRIPDDGKTYPLPPGLGRFPVFPVAEYADRVPEAWRERGGVFIPMYQREALWLRFQAKKPHALKVGAGGINAVTGEDWDEELQQLPQDYVVIPGQPWLDGFKAGEGFIRQFVAMPLGSGTTVEGQLTGEEKEGGMRLLAFAPVPGGPADIEAGYAQGITLASAAPGARSGEMGLGAGGKMRQSIYPDTFGYDAWDKQNSGGIDVHIINSEMFQAITGEAPPGTPISAEAYTAAGLPWFDLYDEGRGDVGAGARLEEVKSVDELTGDADPSVDPDNVIHYEYGPDDEPPDAAA
jgi:hypothetical protein